MDKLEPKLPAAALVAALVVFATTGTGFAASPLSSPSSVAGGPGSGSVQAPAPAVEMAQEGGSRPRELQPRYEPAEPRQRRRSEYDNEYIFGLTRGVADSTMHPAAKVLVFPLTIPLDLALLPFEIIGGFFGS